MLCPSPLFQNRWCIDIRCKQWEQAYHGTLSIGYLSGQACTRWLWLLTNGQCWGAQGLQRIMFLIVVVDYPLWPQEGSYCASREVDGTTLISHLYRKAIGAYNGTMWIFQDLLSLRKSKSQHCMPTWYHEDARRVALYRGAIGGVANPFGYLTWQDIYLYILYASDIVFIFMPQKWFRWW